MLRRLLPLWLVLSAPAFAASSQQCKQACKGDFKTKCEKACREKAPKLANQCIKDMCGMAIERCEQICERPPPKK